MTLKELAQEYKASAAKIKVRLDELRGNKDCDTRRRELLWTEYRDLLKTARKLEGYYDKPEEKAR